MPGTSPHRLREGEASCDNVADATVSRSWKKARLEHMNVAKVSLMYRFSDHTLMFGELREGGSFAPFVPLRIHNDYCWLLLAEPFIHGETTAGDSVSRELEHFRVIQ